MEQQKQPVEAGNSGFGVINPHISPEQKILSATKGYMSVLRVSKEEIKNVFKLKPKERGLNVLSVLLCINATSYSSAHYIGDYLQLDHRTISRSLLSLKSSGMIIVQYRRVFIVPFNAYRSIPTYVITVKGKTVLNKLLNY